VFGKECVCCNADPMGRTQDYDPSTDRVQVSSFPVPVCFECKDHALQSKTGPILQACALIVGGGLTGLGIYYRGQRPDDTLLVGVIVVGAIITLAAAAWLRSTLQREKRERSVAGHHPHLDFSVVLRRPWLDTTNGELVDRILANNPGAERLRTPLLWRKQEAKELAQARVVPPKKSSSTAPKKSASTAPNPSAPIAKPSTPLVAPPVPPASSPMPDKPSLLGDPDPR
jgi:hypothetical protein